MRFFTRDAGPRRRAWASVLLSASLSVGCDLQANAEDLGGTLFDPTKALLDAPGRKLADGRYGNLLLDGSLETGGYVLARRYDNGPSSLSIISFVGDGACEISPIADFKRVSSRVDVALPGLVAYQRARDAKGVGDVEFAGFDCKPRLRKIPSASLPDVPFPRSSPAGLLTLGSDNTLFFVDPVNGGIVEALTGVSSGRAESEFLWTLESGVVVVYDSAFTELASWGDQVRELLVLGGNREPSAAIVDEEGLSFVSVPTGEKTLVAADGCAPVSLGSGVVGYFSPCGTRKLMLSLPGNLVLSEEERLTLEVGEGVVHHEAAIFTWKGNESTILYLTSDDAGSPTGALHVATLGAAGASGDRVVAEQDALLSAGNIYLDWEGLRGRLVTPRYVVEDGKSVLDELTEVARDVGQLPDGSFVSHRGVLANFDGEVGDLCVMQKVDDGYECEKLASRVPVQGQAVEASSEERKTNAFAFVGDYDGKSGTPYLVIDGKPRKIGAKAVPGTLRFLEQPRAVAYLAENGVPGTATLRAWLVDAELDFHVAERVSEYRELPWPSPGLLYAIPEGGDAGIWFAKAR